MQTSLDIDDDVLEAVTDLAARQQRTLGEVVSMLVRQELSRDVWPGKTRNGIPLLPLLPGSKPVTSDIVNQLRDELA